MKVCEHQESGNHNSSYFPVTLLVHNFRHASFTTVMNNTVICHKHSNSYITALLTRNISNNNINLHAVTWSLFPKITASYIGPQN